MPTDADRLRAARAIPQLGWSPHARYTPGGDLCGPGYVLFGHWVPLDAAKRWARAVRARLDRPLSCTVTLDDGTEVDVYGLTEPTAATLDDPGEPWGWARTVPEGVDEEALVRALEVWRG